MPVLQKRLKERARKGDESRLCALKKNAKASSLKAKLLTGNTRELNSDFKSEAEKCV